jgi:TPR repeat protein
MNDILKALEIKANSGDVDAQIYLGWACDRNGTMPYDEARSEYWLRSAVAAGSVEGRRRLTRFLYDRQREEAIHHAEELIGISDFYGYYVMGHIHLHGKFAFAKDTSRAIEYFSNGANQGHIISKVDELKYRKYLWYQYPSKILKLIYLGFKFSYFMIRDPNNKAIYR